MIRKVIEPKAAHVILDVVRGYYQNEKSMACFKTFERITIYIQKKMRKQINFNNFREEYLNEYVQREYNAYETELRKSKKAADKALVKLFNNYDQDLSEEFLLAYLKQCRFRYNCAFLNTRVEKYPEEKKACIQVTSTLRKN
jgi:hypothetical protein